MPDKRQTKQISKSRANLDFEIEFFERLLKRDPKYVEALQILGDAYTKSGQYDKGLKIDQRLARLCPDDELVLYNLACSLALSDKIDKAFETLEKAIERGYRDLQWLRKDRDLEKLRSDPRFEALTKKISAAGRKKRL